MSSGNTSSASLPAWVSPAGTRRSRFYVTSIVLVVSALVLCGAIIIYSNRPALGDDAMGAGAFVLTAAHLLMPYLFSAVVAAITALAILALLPLGRMDRPILQIQDRLQHLAAGDLSSKIRANPSHPQLTELAAELNHSIGALGEQIARWKVLNRVQWDILQGMHQAAAEGDCEAVRYRIGQMEENWQKIAQIEQQLVT